MGYIKHVSKDVAETVYSGTTEIDDYKIAFEAVVRSNKVKSVMIEVESPTGNVFEYALKHDVGVHIDFLPIVVELLQKVYEDIKGVSLDGEQKKKRKA